MNQIVPNGIKVVLEIYHNNQLVETLQLDSYDGLAKFYLSPSFYKRKRISISNSHLRNHSKTEIKI
jgi:hypothetical protein